METYLSQELGKHCIPEEFYLGRSMSLMFRYNQWMVLGPYKRKAWIDVFPEKKEIYAFIKAPSTQCHSWTHGCSRCTSHLYNLLKKIFLAILKVIREGCPVPHCIRSPFLGFLVFWLSSKSEPAFPK